MAVTARVEHVGRLLRPQYPLDARDRYARSELTAAEYMINTALPQTSTSVSAHGDGRPHGGPNVARTSAPHTPRILRSALSQLMVCIRQLYR